jgi:hypothetical protein
MTFRQKEADDRRLGEAGETYVFRRLKESLPGLTRSDYQYAKFDFRDRVTRTDIELKSRRCQITSFPSFFVDHEKVRWGRVRRAQGLSSRTVYLFLFEPLGWKGAGEIWGWVDDGRELETTLAGSSRRTGRADRHLACIPRSVLRPLNDLALSTEQHPLESVEEESDGENSVPLEVL